MSRSNELLAKWRLPICLIKQHESKKATACGGLGPGPGPRPRTRRKAKAQAPKLQPKARPGPKPGNAPDLHDARHASDILDSFAFDFPFPGLMTVAYPCLFCLVLVDQTNGKSPHAVPRQKCCKLNHRTSRLRSDWCIVLCH